MSESQDLASEYDPDAVVDDLPDWAMRADSVVGREDRFSSAHHSRVRSIECSLIDASIIGYELTAATEKESEHMTYIIQVAPGTSKRWTVKRRYNDFVFLDTQLRKPQGQMTIKLPPLPRKRYFGSSTEPKFVEERRMQLEEYLRIIIAIPHVWIKSDLPRFLDNENNSMIFLWNFERVKKMQEILTTMTVESSNDKAKLTDELNAAKEQVAVLQSRINRMEMMFLQNAAGVAAEPLSKTVIRSISGAVPKFDISSGLDQSEVEENATEQRIPNIHEDITNSDENILIEDAVFRHVSDGRLMNSKDVIEILAMTRESIDANTTMGSQELNSEEALRSWALSEKLKEALILGNEVLDEKYYLETQKKGVSFSGKSDNDSNISYSRTDSIKIASENSIEEAMKLFLTTSNFECTDTPQSLKSLSLYFDQIIDHLAPSSAEHEERMKVYDYLRTLVFMNLGAHIFPVGSFVSQTYLPQGDIDVTAFFIHQEDESWFVRMNELLCMTAFGGSGYYQPPTSVSVHSLGSVDNKTSDLSNKLSSASKFTINNVSFVNADVKLIKTSINGFSIDLSANQLGALYLQNFCEHVDEYVGQKHLFKRSLILIKAWCTYESHKYSNGAGKITGSKDGRLSTASLNVMILWIFNAYGKRIHHPLQALHYFLYFFSIFNWNLYALTIRGPVSSVDLSSIDEDSTASASEWDNFFDDKLLSSYQDRFNESRESYLNNILTPLITSIALNDQPPEGVAGNAQLNIAAYLSNPEVIAARKQIEESWITQSAFGDSTSFFKRGLMNIINPVTARNNLSRTVDNFGYRAIQTAFKNGYQALRSFIEKIDSIPGIPTDKQKTLNQYLMTNQSIDDDSSNETLYLRTIANFMVNTCANVIGPMIRGEFSTSAVRKSTPISLSTSPSLATENIPSQQSISNTSTSELFSSTNKDEVDFALNFAEMILGCRVNQSAVISLVIQILTQRGSLPVGEIGKTLQLLTGGDSISRRLKEQYGGLKKTIETADSIVRVGTDHPFNPLLTLAQDPTVSQNKNLAEPTGHALKIVQLQILSQQLKDLSIQANKQNWANASVTGSVGGANSNRKSHMSNRSPQGNPRQGSKAINSDYSNYRRPASKPFPYVNNQSNMGQYASSPQYGYTGSESYEGINSPRGGGSFSDPYLQESHSPGSVPVPIIGAPIGGYYMPHPGAASYVSGISPQQQYMQPPYGPGPVQYVYYSPVGSAGHVAGSIPYPPPAQQSSDATNNYSSSGSK